MKNKVNLIFRLRISKALTQKINRHDSVLEEYSDYCSGSLSKVVFCNFLEIHFSLCCNSSQLNNCNHPLFSGI